LAVLGFNLLALRVSVSSMSKALSNKLNNTTSVLYLLLSFGADITRLNNNGDIDATLA
jgi:hypothetical protein